MRATVVIPTYNGGPLLREVLTTVLRQNAPWPYEIVVVDSSSTDGTAQMLAEAAHKERRLRVVSIPAKDFGHGRTRNYGISLGSGEYAVLITQDAKPIGADWLRFLVDGVAAVPDAWGGFGRHEPWPDGNPFVARALRLHFDRIAAEPPVRYIRDRAEYSRDVRLRQSLHFFSDNNACIRRRIWELYPYPDVDFGEDQLWARNGIEAGGQLVYVDAARVYHGHSYPVGESCRRAHQEAFFFAKHFGYNIGGRLPMSLLAAAAMTIRDWGYYCKEHPSPRPSIRWCAIMCPLNFAVKYGHWQGARRGMIARRRLGIGAGCYLQSETRSDS